MPAGRLSFIPFSRAELALIGITIIWGSTFLLIHLAMRAGGPLFFVGCRFLIAAFVLVFVFRKALRGITWQDVKAGSAIGIALFLGYGLQTMGLQTISSSQSAFITALYVPLVPFLQWLFWRRPPGLASWLGVLMAFGGLMLITGPANTAFAFSVGEAVTLLSALAIAFEIILIGCFAPGTDSRCVTIVQLGVASLACFAAMFVSGEALPQLSWLWWLLAILLGMMSALIQLAMNWAQKSVSPTRATIIYAAEPVWAGIIGRFAGERLPGPAILGAVIIVAGVLVAGLKWPRSKKPLPDGSITEHTGHARRENG